MTRLIPARETERLDALHRLAILDTAPDPAFDAICLRACETFGVPISTVAFIDEQRQWFKASRGLTETATPRVDSFCARTILFDAPLVVADASTDNRYRRNPYVTGPPHIRFYAGTPLSLQPQLRLGTLCIIDAVPRVLTAAQLRKLFDLSQDVIALLRDYATKGGRLAQQTTILGPTADKINKPGRTRSTIITYCARAEDRPRCKTAW